MDKDDFARLRAVNAQRVKFVYDVAKGGRIESLPEEEQLHARAMLEHLHLKHVHNALEFVDVREGAPYEIESEGAVMNPLAHIAVHAAVKGQLAADPGVRAAFEHLVATGTDAHHAEHVLAGLLAEFLAACHESVADAEHRAKMHYDRTIQKLSRDSDFCRKLSRNFASDHFGFE